jgi:3-oxoacyl-[acyl-carrier-protein] synthase-1
MSAYITGSSLISALGQDRDESVEKALRLDEANLEEQLHIKENGYYKIDMSFTDEEEKFNTIVKKAVLDAIEDAGLSQAEREDTHIFIGTTSVTASINEEQCDRYYNHGDPIMLKNVGYGNMGTFIEDAIKSKHKATIIQTACTSTANGLAYAHSMIKSKKIKRALIVGIEFHNKSTYQGFESLMLPSKSLLYRPFDATSDGLILGECCSAVVVEDRKKRDGDFEIQSSATSFDSYSITGSNPSGEATYECMKRALANANMSLKDIDVLKAHATGSENSNISEARAIDRLFLDEKSECSVVVLKPFLGHTLGSCGVSESILLTEMIKRGFLPKTLNYTSGYEDVSFVPLKSPKKVERATILASFIGFGGSNTSLILSNKGA